MTHYLPQLFEFVISHCWVPVKVENTYLCRLNGHEVWDVWQPRANQVAVCVQHTVLWQCCRSVPWFSPPTPAFVWTTSPCGITFMRWGCCAAQLVHSFYIQCLYQFLSLCPFQLCFIPWILSTALHFLALFYWSYFCLIGPFNYSISLWKSPSALM